MRSFVPFIMKPALLFCFSFLLASPALAIYKCQSDHGTIYSDTPCPNAKVLDINSAAPADPDNARHQAAQEKKSLKQLEDARHKSERIEEKDRQRAARAQATVRKTCAKLALRKKWADEDAASATGKSADKARRKARRVEEQFQAECAMG